VIGDDIEVYVLGIERDTVRMAVQIPRPTPLSRRDLIEARDA
jgi:carbon storage regulator CsrA